MIPSRPEPPPRPRDDREASFADRAKLIVFGCLLLGTCVLLTNIPAEEGDNALTESALQESSGEVESSLAERGPPADPAPEGEGVTEQRASVAELIRNGDLRACADPEVEGTFRDLIIESVRRPAGQSAERVYRQLRHEASLFRAKGINQQTNEMVCSAELTLQIGNDAARRFPLNYSLSPSLEIHSEVIIEIDGLSLFPIRSFLESAIDSIAITEMLQGNADAISDARITEE